MKNILHHLKKSWKSIFVIILLLVFQAFLDLSLPDYTSRIINVGVQQGGIENPNFEVVRESTLNALSLFTTEDIKNYYDKIDPSNLTDREYQEYEKKYPKFKEETLYIKKDLSKKEEETLSDILAKPIMFYTMFTSETEEMKKMTEQIKQNLPPQMQSMDLMTAIASMNSSSRSQLLTSIQNQMKDMPDSLVEQTAIAYVKQEYQAIGMNTDQMQIQYILIAGAKMLGIALLIMLSAISVGFLGSRVAARLSRDLRNSVFSKVTSFSKTEFKNFGVASLITRTTNDIQQIQMLILFTLRIIFYAPIIGIGGVIKVLNTNVSMAWIIALAVGVILTIMLGVFFFVMPRFKRLQKLIDRLNLVTREIITGIPVIRAFSNQKYEEKRFDKANVDLKKTTLFVDRIMGCLMPTLMFIMNGICILIVWNGAKGIDQGIMQVGDLLAFIQYTMQIVMAFLMVTMFSIMLPRASVSIGRISEILNTVPVIRDPEKPKEFSKRTKGLIEFKNVSFCYPDSDEEVLTDITFTAKPGETTAFIGSTGSGKSTLINLIPRLFDATKGEILVDGINVKDVDTKELHKKIGFVPQKGVLFAGTIASNIKYGKKDLSDEEMKKAASIAMATEFIESKKMKYNTKISQGGTNVSGGQKQRLSIARAVALKPEILIFDDSFSALDFKTDAALRKALRENTEGTTTLIVAQRISTIMNADQIIVLDEGKVVGKGRHEDLLQTCEIYKEIAESQLGKEEL